MPIIENKKNRLRVKIGVALLFAALFSIRWNGTSDPMRRIHRISQAAPACHTSPSSFIGPRANIVSGLPVCLSGRTDRPVC